MASEFILLANQTDTPLIFLQNTTGYMVGTTYEQGGIIKDGAKMINAVANSAVPHFTINIGRLVRSRQLRHVRPRLRPAADVRLGHRPARGDGRPAAGRGAVHRGAAGRRRRRPRVRRCCRHRTPPGYRGRRSSASRNAFFVTARLYDDGVIDPRDTRTVLAIGLSAAHSQVIEGRCGFGVFRICMAMG